MPLVPAVGNEFRTPEISFGQLDTAAAAKLITSAADVALIVDREGIIRDLAFGSGDLPQEGCEDWIGSPWVETVTVESRTKIEELLRDARADSAVRWRQVNHPTKRGLDVPIRYSAIQLKDNGNVIAIGRDLSSVAALQQRLLAVQQSMEREYSRTRNSETRYRLLFQVASEPVLIFDDASERVVEANPAASAVLAKTVKEISGSPFSKIFDSSSVKAVRSLLAAVRASGKAEEIRGRLIGQDEEFRISLSRFRSGRETHILVHLKSDGAPHDQKTDGAGNADFLKIVENLPDGFVVTDPDLRILTANHAFLDLAQAASVGQIEGEALEDFVGRSSVDLNVLVSALREHGSIRNFATIVHGRLGSTENVDVSAVTSSAGDKPCFGFTLRLAATAAPSTYGDIDRGLPQSAEQISGLIGRAPLKEIVRETTDLIERFCIEAALELTNNNRASAAEMLGLSRQSLYSKLRRHGLGNLE